MPLKHFLNGLLGASSAYIVSTHTLIVIPPTISQQIISALVSIIAGLLTGILSHYLTKWNAPKPPKIDPNATPTQTKQ